MTRGYFGIGIENTKNIMNIVTLWRTAHNLGADFIFTIGKRYSRQASDTTKAAKSIPLYNYIDFDDFYKHTPHDCQLIGAEFPHAKATDIRNFIHPERCIYLLGAEDSGLSKVALDHCQKLIYIPSIWSLNVAVTGSIIIFDRIQKG